MDKCGNVPQRHSIRAGKGSKVESDFKRTAVSNFESERLVGAGNEIIPELRVLVLTKRQMGSGNEIDDPANIHFTVTFCSE